MSLASPGSEGARVVEGLVELLVMRHAKSSWQTGDIDFDRPLSPRGKREAPKMARWLSESDLVPDYVVASAAERARATAMSVIDECSIDRSGWEFRQDLYDAAPADWLDELRGHDGYGPHRILICGHNPTMDQMVSRLAKHPVLPRPDQKLMTTAAIAYFCFESGWKDVGFGQGDLLALVRPRDI